jgi:hypothetical protein
VKCYFCDFHSSLAFSCSCTDCCEKHDLLQVSSRQTTSEAEVASVVFSLDGRVYEAIINNYKDRPSKTIIWWLPSAEDAAPVQVGEIDGIAFTLDNIRKRIKTCLVFS